MSSTSERRPARAGNAYTCLDDAGEPEALRFFHGLLVAVVISLFLWGVLAALGFGAYVLIAGV